MHRVCHPYDQWEDYEAGMFDASPTPKLHTDLAYALLADPPSLLASMSGAVTAWPRAAEHNLTNIGSNRRAWLGAAGCFLACRSPEHTTRDAWWQLTIAQQREANAAADRVIAEWEVMRSGAQTIPW